jgi:RNA polymerase sigma-70 factor (ECF subfamily)
MNSESRENLTSLSLLERLKEPSQAEVAWSRLHELYTPLILRWLRRVPGLAADEAADLTQNVYLVLVEQMPSFQRQGPGSFRTWLRGITSNRIRNHWKARRRRSRVGLGKQTEDFLAELEDPNSDLTQQWDQEHEEHVFGRLLAVVENDFEPTTREAFQRHAIEGRPAAEVAAELGLTENAVWLAKSRILRRLREEGAGLLD